MLSKKRMTEAADKVDSRVFNYLTIYSARLFGPPGTEQALATTRRLLNGQMFRQRDEVGVVLVVPHHVDHRIDARRSWKLLLAPAERWNAQL
jgi:hypothetical protein